MIMKKGSITVFLALVLGLIVALIGAGLQSVQMAAARTQILNSADIGLYSVFGQYDKALLRDYDLFAIDLSGTDKLNLTGVYDNFESYMKPVLKQNSQNLKLDQGGISGYELMTDENGEVFYQQIVRYMKDTLGIQGVQFLLQKMNERQKKTKEAEKKGEDLEKGDSLSSYKSEMSSASDKSRAEQERREKEKKAEDGFTDGNAQSGGSSTAVPKVKVDNPIPAIERMRWMGILSLVLPSNAKVSDKKVNKRNLVSGRKLEEGFQTPHEIRADHSMTSQILYQQYLMEKLGNYRRPGKGDLLYQIEYIICGKDSDQKNLKSIARRLLLIREGVNAVSLAADSQKRAEAEALATAIATGFLIPPAAGVIEAALILCWAYGESILDVRELFAGGKVPMVKNSSNWQLTLENLSGLLRNMDTLRKNDEDGLSYEDYLQILFTILTKSSKVMRGMDMIEISVKEKEGRSEFHLDQCLTAMEIAADVTANRRNTYQVKRAYCYD